MHGLLLLLLLGPCVQGLCSAMSASRPPLAAHPLPAAGPVQSTPPAGARTAHGRRRSRVGAAAGG